MRLLEFFVAEVTARSAADILGFQANTVALFYRKIREVIIESSKNRKKSCKQRKINSRSYTSYT